MNNIINYQKIYKLSKYYHKIKYIYSSQNINYKKKVNLYMKHLKFHIGGNNQEDYIILDSLINQLNKTIEDKNLTNTNDFEIINKLSDDIKNKLITTNIIINKKNEQVEKKKIIYSNILNKISELLDNIKKDKGKINDIEQEKKQKINEINELIKKNNNFLERINSLMNKLYIDNIDNDNLTDNERRVNNMKETISKFKDGIEKNKEIIVQKQNEIKDLDDKINFSNEKIQIELKDEINKFKSNSVGELDSVVKIIFQSLFEIIYSKNVADKIINQ
jgi:chromosome segregation ATPase